MGPALTLSGRDLLPVSGGEGLLERELHGFQRLLTREPEFKGKKSLVKKERESVGATRSRLEGFAEEAGLGRVVYRIVNEVMRLETAGGQG